MEHTTPCPHSRNLCTLKLIQVLLFCVAPCSLAGEPWSWQGFMFVFVFCACMKFQFYMGVYGQPFAYTLSFFVFFFVVIGGRGREKKSPLWTCCIWLERGRGKNLAETHMLHHQLPSHTTKLIYLLPHDEVVRLAMAGRRTSPVWERLSRKLPPHDYHV